MYHPSFRSKKPHNWRGWSHKSNGPDAVAGDRLWWNTSYFWSSRWFSNMDISVLFITGINSAGSASCSIAHWSPTDPSPVSPFSRPRVLWTRHWLCFSRCRWAHLSHRHNGVMQKVLAKDREKTSWAVQLDLCVTPSIILLSLGPVLQMVSWKVVYGFGSGCILRADFEMVKHPRILRSSHGSSFLCMWSFRNQFLEIVGNFTL